MPRRRVFILASLIVSIVVTLGCAAPQAAVSPGAGSTGDGGPKSGGVLTHPITADPYDFDLSYDGKTTANGHSQAKAYNSLLGAKVGPDVRYDEQILQGSWPSAGRCLRTPRPTPFTCERACSSPTCLR